MRGAPGTRLSGFVEALVFAEHVVGLSALSDVTSSRRCLGIARSIIVSDDEGDEQLIPDEAWASDQSGHVTTCSETSSEDERGTPEVIRSEPVAPEGCSFVRNRKTRLLHVLGSGFTRVLACGRVISAAYEHVGEEERLRRDSTVCRQCRRHTDECL